MKIFTWRVNLSGQEAGKWLIKEEEVDYISDDGRAVKKRTSTSNTLTFTRFEMTYHLALKSIALEIEFEINERVRRINNLQKSFYEIQSLCGTKS